MKVYTGCAVSWGCFKLCKCSTIYTFKLLTNLYIHVFMAETFEIMFSCSLSCIATLCSWNEGLTQMMTRKTKVIIKHNERYLRLRREGRNQLMVSQEQMPFMFLVMLHPLPQMKDLKQHMMRKTEVTIQHDKNEWIWWRRAESTSCA